MKFFRDSKISNMLALRLGAPDPQLDSEQIEHMQRWRVQNAQRVVNIFSRASVPILSLSAAVMTQTAPPSVRPACVFTFGALVIVSLAWLTWTHLLKRPTTMRALNIFGLAAGGVAIVGFSSILHNTIIGNDLNASQYIMIGLMFGVQGFMIGLLAPIMGELAISFALVHTISCLIIWYVDHAPEPIAWSLTLCLSEILVVSFFQQQARQSKEHALLNYQALDLASQNQRLRLRAIESELLLAREIQESFIPPPTELITDDFAAHFFHIPHGLLGGDWLAARILPSGAMAIAVGDVSGKGVPAAMVVQSVQSLWAQALRSPEFDPAEWLDSVNDTLIAMGRRHPYTLTLGIMVLEQKRLTYYSAGHVPLLLLGSPTDPMQITSIHGGGSVLGIDANLALKPVVVDFDTWRPHSIFLATDGVLPWQVRRKKSRILKLVQDVRSQGKTALESIDEEDDQILVWVEYAAQFGGKIAPGSIPAELPIGISADS
ncbi:MAG: PP2C family protein-serine/threonine phosphatase [Proteobacteria bacterium]|nr:PP2C family protein-serine/threonine phosphatase [Pseudomonadota bacterium]